MDAIIRNATPADLPFLAEHDRHVTPAELDNLIRLGRILLLKESLRHDITPFTIPDKARKAYNQSIQENDVELLLKVAETAQERFKRKEELCRLMSYHRY